MIAWVPRTPPRGPSATSSPAINDHSATTTRCSHRVDPVTHPTNVDKAIPPASTAMSAIGGRPPCVRHAMPTSMAPAAIVTAATGSPKAMPPPSRAATGIAARRPPTRDAAPRSKVAAARTARVMAAGSCGSASERNEVCSGIKGTLARGACASGSAQTRFQAGERRMRGLPRRVTTTSSPPAARSIQAPKPSRNRWQLTAVNAQSAGVELVGLEPTTSAMPWQRSPS